MATHDQIIARWTSQVGTENPRYLGRYGGQGNVFVLRDELYSWGTHFMLARLMPAADGSPRGWFLLNGDVYSVSTTRHQSTVRAAVERSGLPFMIVPFSVLRSAGIDHATITPIETHKDGYQTTTHHAATLADVPEARRSLATPSPAGGFTYETYRHWLGASVFRAAYSVYIRDEGHASASAYFLSAFDEQEARHYFLCELPADAAPSTIDEALTALRPALVTDADAAGLTVTRQGDVFAVPTTLSTREVRKMAEPQRMARVLDLSHTATEVVVSPDGTTYARGTLRHAPRFGRRAEHRNQRMGDGKTWHQIVKNTVPTDARGENRAWSQAGNVD
jgi:hypothetical protein